MRLGRSGRRCRGRAVLRARRARRGSGSFRLLKRGGALERLDVVVFPVHGLGQLGGARAGRGVRPRMREKTLLTCSSPPQSGTPNSAISLRHKCNKCGRFSLGPRLEKNWMTRQPRRSHAVARPGCRPARAMTRIGDRARSAGADTIADDETTETENQILVRPLPRRAAVHSCTAVQRLRHSRTRADPPPLRTHPCPSTPARGVDQRSG